VVVTALAGAWGLLAALPIVAVARRAASRARVRALVPVKNARRVGWHRWRLVPPPMLAGVVAVLTSPLRRREARRHGAEVRRALPLTVDLLGVAVGAGCTPYTAVEVAARWCPAVIATEFDDVLQRCRLGASFDDALGAAGRSAPRLAPLADALTTATRLGVAIGPTLARVADEVRADLRRAAEQQARTVPVRLLFPLVFLVLPAFALLTVVPVLLSGFGRT
jgi:tight adherence protein C